MGKLSDEEKMGVKAGMVVAGIISTFALRYVEPTRGVGKLAMVSHALFAVFAVALCFAPEKLSDLLFNEAGYAMTRMRERSQKYACRGTSLDIRAYARALAMVGVVFPVFESVRAAASPDGIARKAKGAKERAEDKNSTAARDDTRWLTYWIAAGSIWLCTEWLDSFREAFPQFAENFYHAAIMILMWLQLPMTDGASLMYDKVTKRIAVPLLEPYVSKFNDGSILGSIAKFIGFGVSASHVMFLYFIFIILPSSVERFIVVVTGCLYPIAASIVAVTTDMANDDTQWLVYWVCFASMYLVMLASDDILYWIPGYHSAMLTFVCYLMLPVFNGADSIFRGILVPVFGLKAQLLRRDARVLAEETTKGLTEEQKAAVVASFNEGVAKKTN